MANKYMKRCSTSLVIREMQIKITRKYHFTSIRMAIILKRKKNITVGEDVKKLELMYIAGGIIIGVMPIYMPVSISICLPICFSIYVYIPVSIHMSMAASTSLSNGRLDRSHSGCPQLVSVVSNFG